MTERDAPVVRRSPRRSRRCSAARPQYVVSPGTYDQKHIDRIGGLKDCIAYGPGILDLAHQPDEYVVIDDMVDAAKVMALAMLTCSMGRHDGRRPLWARPKGKGAKQMKALKLAALAVVLVAGFAPGAALAARTDITVGMQLEPPSLDPTSGAAAATDQVTYANIFEGLTRIDQTGAVQPDLAKSLGYLRDGLTYTFHLHDGVKFHDGTPLRPQTWSNSRSIGRRRRTAPTRRSSSSRTSTRSRRSTR